MKGDERISFLYISITKNHNRVKLLWLRDNFIVLISIVLI